MLPKVGPSALASCSLNSEIFLKFALQRVSQKLLSGRLDKVK
jgi:hypothetical protein